jgi:cobalt-zinc-cadmium efflux system membrane fusion protein
MFGHVRILSGVESQVLSVPADAVQSIEGDAYLFVYLEKDLFELRRVEAGAQDGGLITIRFGLSPDDRVVTNQGFALKSEVLKARLGASCADH